MAATSWRARGRVQGRFISLVAKSAQGRAQFNSLVEIPRGSRGISLLELLVVIAVIGVLLGLLLPAIQAIRQSGHRTRCINQQRLLGQAVIEYVQHRGHYPGWRNLLASRQVELDSHTGESTGQLLPSPRPTPASWVVALLPYLDRNDLWLAHGDQGPVEPAGGTRGVPLNVYFDLLVCPVDTRAMTVGGFASRTACSYVANCGLKDVYQVVGQGIVDSPANGVFHNHFPWNERNGLPATFSCVYVRTTYIMAGDGLSSTLLFSENVDAGNWGATDRLETELGMVWWPSVELEGDRPRAVPPWPLYTDLAIAGLNEAVGMIDSFEPDHPDRQYFARPSSQHIGGVVATFCDGGVRFLSDRIDYLIYCLLMTPDGRRAVEAGTGRPVHDLFRYTPLGPDSY